MSGGVRAAAVIPAAGRGERLGGATPKSLVVLRGRPLMQYALATLQDVSEIEAIAVVVPPEAVGTVSEMARRAKLTKVTAVVPGGADRQASVARGLWALPSGPDLVLVHDGARPFLSRALAMAVIAAAARDGSATAALPIGETVKRGEGEWVRETLDRAFLYRIQTPQAFRRPLLERAHEVAAREGFHGTDDAVLVERLGSRVRLVPGDPTNLKVTVPEDLRLAAALLGGEGDAARAPRVGVGFDVHRFGDGRRLVLGGVEIPHPRGLLGHSDADVIVHAVMDALLGAAGCGDIGHHFPPTDPTYRDANSLALLAKVRTLLRGAGWRPVHVDVVVLAEAPRLAPHVPAMRTAIGGVLDLPAGSVNVKATTMEGLGAIGREEGIAAQAVASVEALPASERGGSR
ncbi:MAG TPA: 2-C-methyl-D-erythritol 4-phosphate cytidylyltransferase [bacterium]|nr:2-C-methyl-D-erythritol 4-phosphate cytidylyltransferase [bacterium]